MRGAIAGVHGAELLASSNRSCPCERLAQPRRPPILHVYQLANQSLLDGWAETTMPTDAGTTKEAGEIYHVKATRGPWNPRASDIG